MSIRSAVSVTSPRSEYDEGAKTPRDIYELLSLHVVQPELKACTILTALMNSYMFSPEGQYDTLHERLLSALDVRNEGEKEQTFISVYV